MIELTTHVLDTTHGVPAAGMRIRLFATGDGAVLATAETDSGGRARIAPAHDGILEAGSYDLIFSSGMYFSERGIDEAAPRFLDEVVIRIGLRREIAHYHVPLLISPFGYTTYRGQ